MPHAALPQRGLYAITDGPRADLIEVCVQAIEGGAAMLQYRDKTTDTARRRAEAMALVDVCALRRVPLIVNDDVELAAMVGAAGVHLGEQDGDVAAARARLGADAIIGVSCYDSLERARQLAAAGADYLALGAFFASPTKPQARSATPPLLRDAKALGVPLVAIGGITAENGAALIDAGADFLAVIAAVFAAMDVHAAAKALANLFRPLRS
jgi:thiamine-phosphate pyrophosphorylase